MSAAPDETAWQRWAANASAKRLSARQRRVIRLMAKGIAPTPESALTRRGERRVKA